MSSLAVILLAHVLAMSGCSGTITFVTQPFNITAIVGSNALMPCTALETTDYPQWIIDGSIFQATNLPIGLFATFEGLSIDGSVLENYNSAWFQCSFLTYFGPPVNGFGIAKSQKGYLTVISSAMLESANIADMPALSTESVLSEMVQQSISLIHNPTPLPTYKKSSISLQYVNSSIPLQSPLASRTFISTNTWENMHKSELYSSSAQHPFQLSNDPTTSTLPTNVPPQILFNTTFMILAAMLIALFALILVSAVALLCVCACKIKSSRYLTEQAIQFPAGANQDQDLTIKENSAYAGIVSFQSASNVMTGPGVDHAQWQALQDQGVRVEENSAYAAIKQQEPIQNKGSLPIYAQISDLR